MKKVNNIDIQCKKYLRIWRGIYKYMKEVELPHYQECESTERDKHIWLLVNTFNKKIEEIGAKNGNKR